MARRRLRFYSAWRPTVGAPSRRRVAMLFGSVMEQENSHIAARLFVPAPLTADAAVPLDSDQVHYLRSVLRLGPGGHLALFNGFDGEWLATIETLGKRAGSARPVWQSRTQPVQRGLSLLFA